MLLRGNFRDSAQEELAALFELSFPTPEMRSISERVLGSVPSISRRVSSEKAMKADTPQGSEAKLTCCLPFELIT